MYKKNFEHVAVGESTLKDYSARDMVCAHCGRVVSYNLACLGQGKETCTGCHPENWYPDFEKRSCPSC